MYTGLARMISPGQVCDCNFNILPCTIGALESMLSVGDDFYIAMLASCDSVVLSYVISSLCVSVDVNTCRDLTYSYIVLRCYICLALAFLRNKFKNEAEKKEYENAVRMHNKMHERYILI